MLLARIYETLPLSCPICHRQMRIIAFINEADTENKILDHIGESTRPPQIAPARGASAEGGGSGGGTGAQRSSVGTLQHSLHRRSSSISASPGRYGQVRNKMSRRSSEGGGYCLMPGEWPPVVTLQASGNACGAIRGAFLQIVAHAGPESAIDGCTRGQPYSPRHIGFPILEQRISSIPF